MTKKNSKRTTVSIDRDLLKFVECLIKKHRVANLTHAIELSLQRFKEDLELTGDLKQ